MFRFQPGPERWRLGFAPAVREAFDFLEKEYGLHCTRKEVTFVRYESARVFVNIYHGRGSFELGVEMGMLPRDQNERERGYSLGEILAVVDPAAERAYHPFQVSTGEGVREFVPRLAGLVRKYSGPALSGDAGMFARLDTLRRERFAEWMREQRLRPIREQAAEAWRQRDYERVVRLYQPVEGDLTAVEARKLQYSRKQVLRQRTSPG